MLVVWIRVSSKQTNKNFVSNRNKICFGCASVYIVKPKTKNFGLFRCVSMLRTYIETTETNRTVLKQTETNQNNPKFSAKIPKHALFQTVWVGLLFVSVHSKHRNSLSRYRSETSFEGHPRILHGLLKIKQVL